MFISRYLSDPEKVGAIVPSSRVLCKHIATQAIQLSRDVPIVELGAGSGAITKLLPTESISIEIDEVFSGFLIRKYPERLILNCDAANYVKNLNSPVTIVSSIPLIGNSGSKNIKHAIKSAYTKGMIKSLLTYSYGKKSPFSDCGFKSEVRTKYVLLNIPPASIWVYS